MVFLPAGSTGAVMPRSSLQSGSDNFSEIVSIPVCQDLVGFDGPLKALVLVYDLVCSGRRQQRLSASPSPIDLRGGAKNPQSQSELIISDQVTCGPMTQRQQINSSS